MSPTAARRGAGQLKGPAGAVEFRLLWHQVRVDVPDEETAGALALLGQAAEHSWRPAASIHLQVQTDGPRGYRILDRGDHLARADTPRQVLDVIFERVYRRAFEVAALMGWVRFHGAVVNIAGERLVLTGPSGSGKTTLAVATLLTGGAVESDESFLTKGGQVIAVPRRWHLRPSTLDHFPAAPWLGQAPVLDGDPPLHLLDPTEHGFAWPLGVGPVRAIIVLGVPSEVSGVSSEVSSEAATELRRLAGTGVVRALVGESFPVVESRATILREASALARRADGFFLRRGAAAPLDVARTLATVHPAG